MSIENGPSELPSFVGEMFSVDEDTGELVVNKDIIQPNVSPQERVYGGKTPKQRWELEHSEPDDGIYRGGN